MPTAYTCNLIKEEELSFKDFALKCARAFGACIDMRDEPTDAPIPEEFKQSTYYKEKLNHAKEELELFKKMTDEDFKSKAEENFKAELKYYEDEINKNNFTLKRYKTMLNKVKDWVPPTTEHEGLKNFMIDQITSSINFDSYIPTKPKVKTLKETKNEMLESILHDIAYYASENEKEKERVTARNKWLKDLRKSLEVT